MKAFLLKMKGEARPPQRPGIGHIGWSAIGSFTGIALMALLSEAAGMPLLLAPFGASCVLLFALPDSPLAQPRNVIGGYLLASFIGLLFAALGGYHWWNTALAVAAAIAVMQITHTTHPPAGANPLLIMLGKAGWSFIVNPVLIGSVMLVVVALLFNNLVKDRRYPKYWL